MKDGLKSDYSSTDKCKYRFSKADSAGQLFTINITNNYIYIN